MTVKDLEIELGVTAPTANGLTQDFVKLKVLREITGQTRYQSWPRKSAQFDKWIFCLTAASMIAANQELR
jgi:hypothetical protein